MVLGKDPGLRSSTWPAGGESAPVCHRARAQPRGQALLSHWQPCRHLRLNFTFLSLLLSLTFSHRVTSELWCCQAASLLVNRNQGLGLHTPVLTLELPATFMCNPQDVSTTCTVGTETVLTCSILTFHSADLAYSKLKRSSGIPSGICLPSVQLECLAVHQ